MIPVRREAFLAALLALAVSAASYGSPPLGAPVFSRVAAREGAPGASISGIAQDAEGFVWLGTDRGLIRYDGRSFKRFAHEPFDGGSLVDDSVRALLADGAAIWAGTGGGLARLDLKTERFSSYVSDPEREDSLSCDSVTALAKDGRGFLWVGTPEGLNRLDPATGAIRRFRHDPTAASSLPSDEVLALKADREGRLWVGGAGMGLARFDYGREAFVAYRGGSGLSRGSPPVDVAAIDEDGSGRLWLGCAFGSGRGSGSGASRLALFDPATGRFEDLGDAGASLSSVRVAESGIVYAATLGGGLAEYDPPSGNLIHYRAATTPGSLPGDELRSLFLDRAGDLWIGAGGGELCILSRSRRGCEEIVASDRGMPFGNVAAILVDRRGRLWVGTEEGGIAMRGPSAGAWRRIVDGGAGPFPPSGDSASFLREDGSGVVWTGIGGSLFRYDESAGRFAEAPLPAPGLDRSRDFVRAMLDEPSGGAWIGTLRSGLLYWDRVSGKTLRFRREKDRKDSLSDDCVNALGRDASGRLWVGTSRGLDRLESAASEGTAPSEGARFVRYGYDPTKVGGIPSDSIRTIFLDSRKILWIGTAGGGLMRYEPATDSFLSYTDRDGLPCNVVLNLLEDGKGDLWIATQAGLALYDRGAGSFRHPSSGSGPESEALASGAFAASDGSLLFGSEDRILRFDPESFEFNDHRPPVVLCSVSLGKGTILGAASLAGRDRIELPRGEGSVSFEFAALDYREPERNRYSYVLEGFDGGWSAPGGARRASYTNLPSGDYVFRVKASNGDGLWNEEGLSLKLRVRRNPWTSLPALVLYALLLAAGGFLAARTALTSSLSALRAEAEALRAKLVAASASMESAAIVDALTGLPNRRKIEEHLDLALSRAVRTKLDLAVLMIDIDRFKAYNDRFGKAAGDECLRSVAHAVSACVRRSSDVVARYGGEEFLVVLEETTIVGALSEAEAIRRAVEALGAVTVSVGCVSMQPDAECSHAILVAAAEKALMAAKMLGRNRVSP